MATLIINVPFFEKKKKKETWKIGERNNLKKNAEVF